MAPRRDPSPLRWLIGVELSRYREGTGLRLSEVAEQTGMSRAKVGHLETGFQQQDPDDIATLLGLYGVERRDLDRLTALTNCADETTWWAPWAKVLPDWLKTFVGLEGLAEAEFIFEPMIVPGQLQTGDYATAITAETPRVRPDHGERVVNFRLARANRLTDPNRPLRLHAVIGEAALRLAVGTPEIRRAQLEHLIHIAALPNVTIQVIRPEDGFHTAMTGKFIVLDFEQARPIAYSELHDGAVYIQDQEQVRSYKLSADNLQRVALGPEKSVALLRSMLKTRT
jgi:transcriptional regulator with XRE-family HTH domain